MNRLMMIACVCVGSQMAVAGAPSDRIKFRAHHELGDVTRMRMATKTVGTMEMPGPMPDQQFAQTFEQDFVSTCKKVNPDKTAVLDITMGRIAMSNNVAGFKMEFDSKTYDAEKAANPMVAAIGRMFNAMVGTKFTLTVGPDGRPIKVEGLSEAMKRMMDSVGDDVPGPMKKMFSQLGEVFDDDSVLDKWAAHYRMIPSEPVGIGDTWSAEWDMDMPFMGSTGIRGESKYVLLAVEELRGRRCAKIGIVESFETKPKDPKADAGTKKPAGLFGNFEMAMQASGGKGMAYVDVDKGELVQLRQTQKMDIKVTMAGTPGKEDAASKPTPMSIVQKLNTSVRLDLIDGTEAADVGGPRAATP